MIITQTPFRMSFFGGGTDMPRYFAEHGGAVISTTFDKYCYCILRRLPGFFDYSTELIYSQIERVNNVEDIAHPAIREAMKMLQLKDIRLSYEADLPARSGLGTSSSFAVGMLGAFHHLKGEDVDRHTLAEEAIYLERTLLAETGGWQDQIAASYGGLNRIDFGPNGFRVRRLDISAERKKALNDRLLMFFTGFTRFSAAVQDANQASAPADKNDILGRMKEMVDEAESILTDESGSLSDFGCLLDETWRLKKRTGGYVSTDGIDRLYEEGLRAGALGGKLLGAGGGGFLIFYAEPHRQESVIRAMDGLMRVPFCFEEEGSRLLFSSEVL